MGNYSFKFFARVSLPIARKVEKLNVAERLRPFCAKPNCKRDDGWRLSPMPDCTSPGLKERERHSTYRGAVYRRPGPAFCL